MTSKERAILRARASLIDTIMIIGKGGIGEEIYTQASKAISARELIKCKVLETAMISAREAAVDIAEKIGAEVVCSIGSKFVLYKKNTERKPKKVIVKPVKVRVTKVYNKNSNKKIRSIKKK